MKDIQKILLLMLATIIWGFAFVAQSKGGELLGAFCFNASRTLIGALTVFIFIKILDKKGISQKPTNNKERNELIKAGSLTGLALLLATSFQQIGIATCSSVGKAGFLTSTYIVMVPLAGLFLKRKVHLNVYIAVLIDLLGLYLLTMSSSLTLQAGDIYILLAAFMFTIQILLVDYYAPKLDKMRFALIQYLSCGLISLILAIIFEKESLIFIFNNLGLLDMWVPVLYAGILSTGVAYTLQIICQDGLNPTLATIVMSLESVFSVIAGFLLLHQVLSIKEIIGCIACFVAVLLAQIR